ncbi:MAG: DUF692 family protein, partial [Methylophilaceae bacterium]|nr:DUF692 family protein [Methylophilaceae bacterium]
CAVASAVWNLYCQVLERTGPVTTLIEWDNDIPTFERLVEEAEFADRCLATAWRTHKSSSRYE